MKRAELEALSAEQLRQLIADAAGVLAERCAKSAAGLSAATAAPAANGAGSIFSFGGGGSSNDRVGGSSGGLFSPPARVEAGSSVGGLFASLGQSGATTGGLFSGTLASSHAGAGLFSFGEPVPQAAPARADNGSGAEDDEADEHLPDEEVIAVHGWTPAITLEVLDKVETGEEGEEQLYCQRSKLYRFKDGEWKERGLGDARLMRDKTTGRVRFLLRQERTGKVAANHFVLEHEVYCDLRPNADSEKIWVWVAQDFAEGELTIERFALKFGSVELAADFKAAFEDAKCRNKEALSSETPSK
mmetsp:Transcript_114959/g.330148  ORF Transcript_114959/g.330148 Transcript_114959/m.330148 type:complete len:302 (-) Transcript_114959:54-959(-)